MVGRKLDPRLSSTCSAPFMGRDYHTPWQTETRDEWACDHPFSFHMAVAAHSRTSKGRGKRSRARRAPRSSRGRKRGGRGPSRTALPKGYIRNPRTGRLIRADGPTASIPKGRRTRLVRSLTNPRTGRRILPNGPTARKLRSLGVRLGRAQTRVVHSRFAKGCSNARRPGRANLPKRVVCGPAGGACDGSYPVRTRKEVVAALSRAWHAPNPAGIRRCAYQRAKKMGWLSNGRGKPKRVKLR